MKKAIVLINIIVATALIGGAGYYFLVLNKHTAKPKPVKEVVYKTEPLVLNLSKDDSKRYLRTEFVYVFDDLDRKYDEKKWLDENYYKIEDLIIKVVRKKSLLELAAEDAPQVLANEVQIGINELVGDSLVKETYTVDYILN